MKLGIINRLISRKPVDTNPKDYTTVDTSGQYVPCQAEAYFLCLNNYVKENDKVLDIGFGLGYGLTILSIKAKEVHGVDVDQKAVDHIKTHCWGKNPKIKRVQLYDGYRLPYTDNYFDIITCVDVLEHVEDYDKLVKELLRVSKRGVFFSTPNRRPEYTNSDGTPKNYWHLREWSKSELNTILKKHGNVSWNVLNGPFSGPFSISKKATDSTLTLSPFIQKNK